MIGPMVIKAPVGELTQGKNHVCIGWKQFEVPQDLSCHNMLWEYMCGPDQLVIT